MLPPTRGGGGGRAPQQLTPRITSRSVMPDQTLVEGEGEREREREMGTITTTIAVNCASETCMTTWVHYIALSANGQNPVPSTRHSRET